jgi:hypothetical protein
MTTVRIAHAEPRPGRLSNGEFQTRGHLVVLADDGAHRAVPLWLTGPSHCTRRPVCTRNPADGAASSLSHMSIIERNCSARCRAASEFDSATNVSRLSTSPWASVGALASSAFSRGSSLISPAM